MYTCIHIYIHQCCLISWPNLFNVHYAQLVPLDRLQRLAEFLLNASSMIRTCTDSPTVQRMRRRTLMFDFGSERQTGIFNSLTSRQRIGKNKSRNGHMFIDSCHLIKESHGRHDLSDSTPHWTTQLVERYVLPSSRCRHSKHASGFHLLQRAY